MGSKDAKLLRGQLRQIVKEMLPELIKQELFTESTSLIRSRLEEINKMVKSELTRIDDRQKDIQALIMKELAASSLPKLEPNE